MVGNEKRMTGIVRGGFSRGIEALRARVLRTRNIWRSIPCKGPNEIDCCGRILCEEAARDGGS